MSTWRNVLWGFFFLGLTLGTCLVASCFGVAFWVGNCGIHGCSSIDHSSCSQGVCLCDAGFAFSGDACLPVPLNGTSTPTTTSPTARATTTTTTTTTMTTTTTTATTTTTTTTMPCKYGRRVGRCGRDASCSSAYFPAVCDTATWHCECPLGYCAEESYCIWSAPSDPGSSPACDASVGECLFGSCGGHSASHCTGDGRCVCNRGYCAQDGMCHLVLANSTSHLLASESRGITVVTA